MKTATGACKYCGQIMTIEVPDKFKQADINEEIIKKCDCPEAKAITKQQEMIASAEGMIKDFFKDREGMDVIKLLLLSAVEPIAKGEIGAISISKGSYTGTMKPGKDTIKVSLKCTTVDSVES